MSWSPCISHCSNDLQWYFGLTEDTVDAEEFEDFAEGLLPLLINFNGGNPNSIVILDNCAIHHANDIAGILGL